jgi:hypothetical protein
VYSQEAGLYPGGFVEYPEAARTRRRHAASTDVDEVELGRGAALRWDDDRPAYFSGGLDLLILRRNQAERQASFLFRTKISTILARMGHAPLRLPAAVNQAMT